MTRTSSSSRVPESTEAAVSSPLDSTTGEAPGPTTRRPRRALAPLRRIARAIGSALVVLWGAATVAFFAQRAPPGERATIILHVRAGQAQLRTPAELAQIKAEFGLDRPILVQYLDYLVGLV